MLIALMNFLRDYESATFKNRQCDQRKRHIVKRTSNLLVNSIFRRWFLKDLAPSDEGAVCASRLRERKVVVSRNRWDRFVLSPSVTAIAVPPPSSEAVSYTHLVLL